MLKSQRIPEFKVRLYLSSVASKSEKKLRRAMELCMEADRTVKLSPQGYEAIERLIGTL